MLNDVSRLYTGLIVAVASLMMTIQPFLTLASKDEHGEYGYSIFSATFFTEVVKLCVSFVLYANVSPSMRSHAMIDVRLVLKFAVPACIYAINNHLFVFVILSGTVHAEDRLHRHPFSRPSESDPHEDPIRCHPLARDRGIHIAAAQPRMQPV